MAIGNRDYTVSGSILWRTWVSTGTLLELSVFYIVPLLRFRLSNSGARYEGKLTYMYTCRYLFAFLINCGLGEVVYVVLVGWLDAK